MKTRHDRAQHVRNNHLFFRKYTNPKAADFLRFALKRYEENGITELARDRLPALIDLSAIGTATDAANAFGGKAMHVLDAVRELQHQLYQ